MTTTGDDTTADDQADDEDDAKADGAKESKPKPRGRKPKKPKPNPGTAPPADPPLPVIPWVAGEFGPFPELPVEPEDGIYAGDGKRIVRDLRRRWPKVMRNQEKRAKKRNKPDSPP